MPERTSATSSESRIEQYDGGEVLYLAVDPDGVWARSEFPDDLVTVDYDDSGELIGVEVIGDLAKNAREGLLRALLAAESVSDPEAVKETLRPVLTGT